MEDLHYRVIERTPVNPATFGLETLRRSLKKAFSEAVSAEVAGELLRLSIGSKTAWVNSSGELEGEASHSTV